MKQRKKININALFGFVIRTKQHIIGRETLKRNRRKISFILLSTDISDNGIKYAKRNFDAIPLVQRYTMLEIEEKFKINGTKMIGLKKSKLTDAVYEYLKDWRLNG